MPSVDVMLGLNSPLQNLQIKDDFPTPASPAKIIYKYPTP